MQSQVHLGFMKTNCYWPQEWKNYVLAHHLCHYRVCGSGALSRDRTVKGLGEVAPSSLHGQTLVYALVCDSSQSAGRPLAKVMRENYLVIS